MLKGKFKSKLFSDEKTFRPSKQYKKNTKGSELYHLKVQTAGGKWSTRETVRLPKGEDLNDWLACNTIDFYNQVNVIYGSLSEVCTDEDCPLMTAGDHFQYYWADGTSVVKPLKCSAPEYVGHLMTWVRDQLDDEDVFVTDADDDYPSDFKKIVKTIFRKLFRVYAHIYHSHYGYVEDEDEDKHLNAHFKHFLFFVQEFELIDAKELLPLDDVIRKLSKHK